MEKQGRKSSIFRDPEDENNYRFNQFIKPIRSKCTKNGGLLHFHSRNIKWSKYGSVEILT